MIVHCAGQQKILLQPFTLHPAYCILFISPLSLVHSALHNHTYIKLCLGKGGGDNFRGLLVCSLIGRIITINYLLIYA